MENMEVKCNEARREMRRRLLALKDPELLSLYYRTVTLSEHEAARRMRSEMIDDGSYADLRASGGIVGAP